jgi:hypothetical protein
MVEGGREKQFLCRTLNNASSISGYSPNVAEKRTFGALLIRLPHEEVRAAYGLKFREHVFFSEDLRTKVWPGKVG